ncbi:MAG: oxaloacetate decarboxylase [Saprospiraceae bacterium]|nr:oxaloacetate decarboxylase [Saprospiraceae bacterium]
MGREIKLCLVYRDMWQSSGKYMPRVDQLVRVAEPIIEMGCFSRVETNGGGFEQINLLYGENPNRSVREWTTPFNEVGIQTQMLERGLNGLRMSPVPSDVRQLMFKVKKKQGTDISRSFDGLNFAANLENSFVFAKEAGMIAQGCLCITHSKLHTVEYFVKLADQLIELGAEEICLKDMAGVGRPVSIGKITKGIRERHPDILIQYHGHSTPGFSIVSSLEAARNGADVIDVGMEPLSWGTGHADLLTVHAMLVDAGFSVPDINMKAYMQARSLTLEFMDDFLGYFIDQRNRFMSSLLIGPGLPGGMMGSLMADLNKNLSSLNNWLEKRGSVPVDQETLLIKLFEEVEYIWPKMGYPPLVTPYSQYVKNTALMNVLQMMKGRERWSMVDENTWNMLSGKAGKLPGPLGEDLVSLANGQNREFFYGTPQDLYPDELELFAGKMDEKGWDYGEDDEELMEYAMHPQQYEDYKSGKAKERFLEELAQKKKPKSSPTSLVAEPVAPKHMRVTVNGEAYEVAIDYPKAGDATAETPANSQPAASTEQKTNLKAVLAPLEGKFFLTKDSSETAIQVGDLIKAGETIGYIEAMKVYNAVSTDKSGVVMEIMAKVGEEVEEDDVLIKIQ